MLKPIPRSILCDSMILKVPAGEDAWHHQTYDDYSVKNVHIQNTNEVRKTTNNTEVVLRSKLFVDSRYSRPKLDFDKLASDAETSGVQMRCVVYDRSGNQTGEYSVQTVDAIPDYPSVRVHHYELGLV